jgi:tellurium resistance protein TerD
MQAQGNGIDVNTKKITIGLGWDKNNSNYSDEFDLDVSAFLLNRNKLMPRDDYFVYYNNLKSYDNSTILQGDNRIGGNYPGKDNDNEEIIINLDKIDTNIVEIVFTATIFKALERKQNFGQVKNSYIRIYNSLSNEVIARYDLEEDFSVETSVEFGRLYLEFGSWKFEGIGNGYKEGLELFIDKYAQ